MYQALRVRTYGDETQNQHLTPAEVQIAENFLENVTCVQKVNNIGRDIGGKLNQVSRNTAIQYGMTEIINNVEHCSYHEYLDI